MPQPCGEYNIPYYNQEFIGVEVTSPPENFDFEETSMDYY